MKYIHSVSQIPKTPHFGAFLDSSIYIPGDARSESHPGHGYPSENKEVVEYIVFDSKTEMEGWVDQQEKTKYGKKEYRIVEIKPLTFTTKTTIHFE